MPPYNLWGYFDNIKKFFFILNKNIFYSKFAASMIWWMFKRTNYYLKKNKALSHTINIFYDIQLTNFKYFSFVSILFIYLSSINIFFNV